MNKKRRKSLTKKSKKIEMMALNEEDCGSDYVSEDDKERVVAEQKNSFKEMNELINAQRFGSPGVGNLRSNNSGQPSSHQ
jgi:hypothetical protein